METFDGFEYTKKDLIGHGAFAIVYKGRYTDVSILFINNSYITSIIQFIEKKYALFECRIILKFWNNISNSFNIVDRKFYCQAAMNF